MRDSLFGYLNFPDNLDIPEYSFHWDGTDAHLHSISETPLKRSLLGKTNNALGIISIASLVWTAKRISKAVDVSKILQVAEAYMCWQSSPLYYDRDSPKFFDKDITDVGLSIVEAFGLKGTRDFYRTPHSHTAFPPLQDTANIIEMSRHVIEKRFETDYKNWLEDLIQRLDKIASNPHQNEDKPDPENTLEWETYLDRHMGKPLPLEVANTSKPFNTDDRAKLYSQFLQSVDWTSNPYLASPEKMKALGFTGKPYHEEND